MHTWKAIPVARGCGQRKKGGIYAECGLNPYGTPVEHFVFDPPVPADLQALGLTHVGVRLLEREGTTHLADYVGEEHYPNVCDFIEETRRFGLSRRLPKTLDFPQLTPQSRILLLHRKAWIENANDYCNARPQLATWPCPTQRADHQDPSHPPPLCASLWREDLVEGTPTEERMIDPVDYWSWEGGWGERYVVRTMPAFSYGGARRPDAVVPRYQVAFFLWLPLARLVVIRDPEGGTHEEALTVARCASLPVELAGW
jgi:hypothetical protein